MRKNFGAIMALSLLLSVPVMATENNDLTLDLVFYQDGIFVSLDNFNSTPSAQVTFEADNTADWEFAFDEYLPTDVVTAYISNANSNGNGSSFFLYIDNGFDALGEDVLPLGFLTFDDYDVDAYATMFSDTLVQTDLKRERKQTNLELEQKQRRDGAAELLSLQSHATVSLIF